MSIQTKALVAFMFLLSGATSLILETVWIRILSLGTGATSTAIGMVLAIFFLGLAIGSYLAGSFAHKIRRPILWYGLMEGLVGLYAFVLIHILLNFHNLIQFAPHTGDFAWVGSLVKFAWVTILLLPASIGMGASLPILVRLFLKDDAGIGRLISFLYGLNTLGAVLGALLAGFILIPQMGVLDSSYLASYINIGIAFFGVALTYLAKGLSFSISSQNAEKPPEISSSLSAQSVIFILICCASGYTSIAAEVVWNKYLGIYFGTNIYGLGLILSVFLLGIALGSLSVSLYIDRIKDRNRFLALLLVLGLISIWITTQLLSYAPLIAGVIGQIFGNWISLLTIKSIVGTIMLLPTTLIFGGLFPVAIRCLTTSASQAPKVVGVAYAANTVGSIVASYLTGVVLVSLIGSTWSMRIALLVLGFVTIAAFWVLFRTEKLKWLILRVGFSTALVALLVVTIDVDFRNIIRSAYFKVDPTQPLSLAETTSYFDRDREEFKLIVEGKTAIISLSHDKQDGPSYREFLRLKTNGLNESIYDTNNPHLVPKYEALLGLLPYLFTRDAKNAFVVGYGGGFTVRLLDQLDLDEIHVAELEEGILDAANYANGGRDVRESFENLNLVIEDARFDLTTKQNHEYDILVSQPSHSWLTGVANLFTKEYFEIVRNNLSPKGAFAQWLNLYNMDREVLRSILKTFYMVFPNGYVFTDRKDDELIMIGSMHKLELNLDKLQAMTRNPTLKRNLQYVPFNDPYSFLTNYSMSRSEIVKLTADAEVNTDINAYAEVRQSKLFYRGVKEEDKPQTFFAQHYTGDLSQVISKDISKDQDFYYKLLKSMQQQQKVEKFFSLLKQVETLFSHDLNFSTRLSYLYLNAQRYASAEKVLKRALKESGDKDDRKEFQQHYLAVLYESKRFKALSDFAASEVIAPSPLSECYIAAADAQNGHLTSTMIRKVTDASRTNGYLEQCGDFYPKLMGLIYYKLGDYDKAIFYLEQTYAKYGQDVDVVRQLLSSYIETKSTTNAEMFAEYYPTVLRGYRDQLSYYENRFRSEGLAEDADILKNLREQYQ